MVSCCVTDCDVTYQNNPEKHTFHKFPKNPRLREKWMKIIARPDWTPKKGSLICSKHFEEKFIVRRQSKNLLLRGVIPTLFVPVKLKSEKFASSCVVRDITPPPSPLPYQINEEEITIRYKCLLTKCSKLKERIKLKQKRIRKLTSLVKRQDQKIESLQELLDEIIFEPEVILS